MHTQRAIVRANDNTLGPSGQSLILGSELEDLSVVNAGPAHKLVFPLLHGNAYQTIRPNWTANLPEVHRTMARFLMVHAAVTPVSVFPAPQGRTIRPEL